MKKALLLTWHDGCNYGTFLQCYCLKKIIEDPSIVNLPFKGKIQYNIEVRVLNYNENKKISSLNDKIKNIITNPIDENISKLLNKIKLINFKIVTHDYRKEIENREKIFNKFRKDNFNFYPDESIGDYNELKKLKKFDFYIIGSDQVWNPNLLDPIYLLDWASPSNKKFSYAPSLCVNNIKENQKYLYKKLSDFNNISVRENVNAVKQLEEITNKKVNIVVDPVILYGRDALLKECRTNNMEDKYVLSYLIGDTRETRKYFLDFANKNKIKMKSVIAINPLHVSNDNILKKYAIWDNNPMELINQIYNAEVIVTDSFHVMVISALLHKNFIILPRENSTSQQNNRIMSFLKLIGLEKIYNFKPNYLEELNISKDEWKRVDERINIERKKSFDYLIKCLS